jgi:transposase
MELLPFFDRDPEREYKRAPGGGRKPVHSREAILMAIWHVLSTGCYWRSLPEKQFGVSGKLVHKYHMKWARNGFYFWLWATSVTIYNEVEGIAFERIAVDGTIIKARKGGEETGYNYKDTGMLGTKRNVAVDGRGAPVSMTQCPANTHDVMQLEPLLDNMLYEVPEEMRGKVTLYADKAYEGKKHIANIVKAGFKANVMKKGAKRMTKSRKENLRYRFPVEACHFWMNNFKKLIIRYEKTACSYFGLMYLAACHIVLRKIGNGCLIYDEWSEEMLAA